jgi:hypothetical protein
MDYTSIFLSLISLKITDDIKGRIIALSLAKWKQVNLQVDHPKLFIRIKRPNSVTLYDKKNLY